MASSPARRRANANLVKMRLYGQFAVSVCVASWRLQRRHFPFFSNLRYIHGMLGKYATSQMRSPWRVLLGVLCIALIMVGGIVAVTHTHSQREISHQDCGLCVTAHMAVQVAVTRSEERRVGKECR